MRECRNRKCFSHSCANPLHAGEVSKPQRVSEAPILAAVTSVWDGAFCIGIRECVTWLYWSYCVLWSLVVVLYPRRRSSVFELLIWRNRGTTLRFWHVMFTELLWGSWLYPGHTHNPYHHFSLWILSNSFILHYLHSCDDVLMLFFRFVELIPAGHWVSGLSVLVILVSLSP